MTTDTQTPTVEELLAANFKLTQENATLTHNNWALVQRLSEVEAQLDERNAALMRKATAVVVDECQQSGHLAMGMRLQRALERRILD